MWFAWAKDALVIYNAILVGQLYIIKSRYYKQQRLLPVCKGCYFCSLAVKAE